MKKKEVDFNAELEKFGPNRLKEKKLDEIKKGTKANLTIVTLEGVEIKIEWTVDEIKVVEKKYPGALKEMKLREFYDDLHQFLLAESLGYRK